MLKPLKIEWFIFLIILTIMACETDTGQTFDPIIVEYPPGVRDTSYQDSYFGMQVSDPYHWMEDPDSMLTRQWIQSQRALTLSYLSQIPFRQAIADRLEQLWDYTNASAPFPLGDSAAQWIQLDYRLQPVLYGMGKDNNRNAVLFDPNQMPEFQDAMLSKWSFSKDGRYLAMVAEEAGGQLQSIAVVDLENGSSLVDEILNVKDTRIAWYRNGFFYSKYEAPVEGGGSLEADYFHQVYYHELGRSPANDELIFADRSAPMQLALPIVDQNESYLILTLKDTSKGSRLLIKDLKNRTANFQILIDDLEDDYEYVGAVNDQVLLLTNDGAPNNELVKVRIARSGGGEREVVIPESGMVLQDVYFYGKNLLAIYNEEGAPVVMIFDSKGNNPKRVDLPQPGMVTEVVLDSRKEQAFLIFSSFLEAPKIYVVDLVSGGLDEFMSTFTAFNPNDYQVRKLNYRAFGGDNIPMYLIHKRGMEISPNTPALLVGNGSKHYTLGPRYNLTGLQLIPFFLESNGLVAIPLIRGTPNMGKFWYTMGVGTERQKSLDDFQAAASFLIEQGYTSTEKLAAYGQGPVGGLLVTACLIQRPDLFNTVIAREGIYDLLKYQNFTTAWKYADELGITENKADFDPLWAIDPRRNAITTEYPATLLVASTANAEIVPLHTYKLTAELQARQKADRPVLMRLGSNFFDRGLRPHPQAMEEGTDILSFLFYQLRHDPFEAEQLAQ